MLKQIILIAAASAALTVFSQTGANKGRTVVLEASKIEGKLKRPQAALMAIEKRPVFRSIALSTSSFQKDILKSVDTTVFEYRIYTEAFSVTTK